MSVRGRVYGYVKGAGCVWVVLVRLEWLSEKTVLNSLTLEPVDCIINHIY